MRPTTRLAVSFLIRHADRLRPAATALLQLLSALRPEAALYLFALGLIGGAAWSALGPAFAALLLGLLILRDLERPTKPPAS